MAGVKPKVNGEIIPGRGGRRARRKILPRIAVAAALGVLFLAAAVAASTTAAPPAAVTPAAPTTSPGSSGYVNPYTPPAGRDDNAASKSPGSWEVYPSPTTRSLFAVDFVDVNNGWAVGNGVILRYQSGTWSVFYQNTRYYFEDIDMVSANDGWLVCFDFNDIDAEIWRWDGASWTLFQEPGGTLYCIDMIDANHGWIGDNPAFIRFNGSSWVTDGYASGYVLDIQMNSDTDGRAAAYHWIMKKTGTDWVQELYNADWYLASIYMVNANKGWAAGQYIPSDKAFIVKYEYSWSLYEVYGDATFLVDLDFAPAGWGWAVGRKYANPPMGGFLCYCDGQNWTVVTAPTDKGLLGIDIIDADNAWVVGESGVILKYKPNIAVVPTSLGRIKATFH